VKRLLGHRLATTGGCQNGVVLDCGGTARAGEGEQALRLHYPRVFSSHFHTTILGRRSGSCNGSVGKHPRGLFLPSALSGEPDTTMKSRTASGARKQSQR
jgi:hypothetical protein